MTSLDESKIRARVFDVVRRIIDIPPASGSNLKNLRKDFLRPPPMKEFQGIDPVLLYKDQRQWFFHPRECTPKILWPVDVCVIQPSGGDDIGLLVQRWRSIQPREVRGYAKLVSPYMMRRDVGAESAGQFVTVSSLHSYIGGRWPFADAQPTSDNLLDAGGLAIAVALRQRYEWAVNIGFEDLPSVRIATDPTGMKELFRLRDVADGRDRRDALMTWVSDHWRKDRVDPDVERYVRKHMRGAAKFDWRGMVCEIKPSQFDLEQRDAFLQEREAMRKAGSDKRVSA
jgi:hypothetical protein